MILELVSGVSVGMTMLSGGAAYLMFRQYLALAEASLEFAAVVVESIREQEDGSIIVDPMNLAGVSMDHLSQISGLIRWIKK